MQLSLLEPTQSITKTIKNIPLNLLELSPFNYRHNRSDDHIGKLSGRMQRYGFELTRALWVYQNNDKFLVFAGGTRLKAASIAKLNEVPCIVHEGLSEDDIAELTRRDNSNDEYHEPVSVVEEWAECARLSSLGWTQQRIASVSDCPQSTVSERIKFNSLGDGIKSFIAQGFLSERHLREILTLSLGRYLSQWLTTDSAMLELCQIATKDKLTVRDTKKVVEQWKGFIDLATKAHDELPIEWQVKLIDELAKAKARSDKEVQRAIDTVTIAKVKSDKEVTARLRREQIEKELREIEENKMAADAISQRELEDEIQARKAIYAEHRARIDAIKFGDTWDIQGDKSFISLICGKAESIPQIADGSIDLIITSPPYNFGGDFWPMGGGGKNTSRDNGIGYDLHDDNMPYPDYFDWQIKVLQEMYRVAKDGASFFYNHKVRQQDGGIIHPLDWLRRADNQWTIRQEIIWDRKSTHNHVTSLFWQHDERIYWLTKGKPIIPNQPIGIPSIWVQDFMVKSDHPAPFTPALPRMILEIFRNEGMTVLDPFVGSGTTIDVCNEMGVNAIGVDISAEYIKKVVSRYE